MEISSVLYSCAPLRLDIPLEEALRTIPIYLTCSASFLSFLVVKQTFVLYPIRTPLNVYFHKTSVRSIQIERTKMSSMYMFLLNNICIVHRLHEKLTKSKRFKEVIVRKFATVQKTQSFVLCWRGLRLQGVVSRKQVVACFVEQSMRLSGIRQSLSHQVSH